MDQILEQAIQALRQSRQIAVLTGAGVSKESGIPTFRDAIDGLWSRYDPTQLATPQAFRANPKLVWDFYEYRRQLMRPAQPNPGHVALAGLQQRYPTLRIITQNVDNLHERAGSTDVIRLHGSIAHNKCFFNCQGDPTPVDISQIEWDRDSGPPPCPYCGRWVRPAVVWFGEMLPRPMLLRALDLVTNCDLLLVVGTSGMVSPSSEMPAEAKARGALVIEINPDTSMISHLADLRLSAPSGVALPQLLNALTA